MQTLFHAADPGPTGTDLGIFAVLRELDSRLAEAIRISSLEMSGTGIADQFRGLYVSQGEAKCSLQHAAGEPLYGAGQSPLTLAPTVSSLKELRDIFSLSLFDLAIVVVALAPEIDLRYERVYSFLQNDVTRKRPLVDLILNLLCCSAEERLIRRRHFAPTAPLLRHRIVSLFADPNCGCPPLLAHALKLDEGIVQFLLGEPGLDGRIAHYCRLSAPGGVAATALQDDLRSGIACLGEPVPESARPVVLLLRGKSRQQMLEAAQAAATEQRRTLLIADFSRCVEHTNALEQDVMLVLREAKLRHAIPYLDSVDDVSQCGLLQAIRELGEGVVAVFTKTEMVFPSDLCRVITIDFPALDFAQRRACWKCKLNRQEIETDDQTLDSLAGRFRLTPEEIERAVGESCLRVSGSTWLGKLDVHLAKKASPAAVALFASARGQSGQKLTLMTRKLCAKQTWSDLVLPEETVTQLREFCGRIVANEQVLSAWGFDRKLSYGKGASALFAGLSAPAKPWPQKLLRMRPNSISTRSTSQEWSASTSERRRKISIAFSPPRRMPTQSFFLTKRTLCLASGRKCEIPITGTPTLRSVICCKRWRPIKALPSSRPT